MANIFLSTKKVVYQNLAPETEQKGGKSVENWEPETLKTIFMTRYVRETSSTKLNLVLFLDLD